MNLIREITPWDLDEPAENILPLRFDRAWDEEYDDYELRIEGALRQRGKEPVGSPVLCADGQVRLMVRNIRCH